MRPAGRHQPKESLKPPSTPVDFYHRQFPGRDSDASFASSRPSSAGVGVRTTTVDLYKERSFQQSAVSTINSYLALHSVPISFKTTCPSAKDITETLKFLMNQLDFPSTKIEDSLPVLLKALNYPFKLNKSFLKSPAAPHQWPTLLALIHWLVQIASFNDHLSSLCETSSYAEANALNMYALNSYLHYIRGDDDAVDELDRQCKEKLEKEKGYAVEKMKATEEELKKIAAECEELRTRPSQKEVLEKEKSLLEDDVNKFHKMIEEFTVRIKEVERGLSDKEKQLEAKVQENKNICEENEELKKRVELQTFNARDMERMRKELQAVERDIAEAELARNAWEEKSWELETSLGHKVNDLEALALDCNQALRRLKIDSGIQYQLNAKGSTPAEIMGINPKLTLKPVLNSFADDIKKSSMKKLEESMSLQQKCGENAARIEKKRNKNDDLLSKIDEVEAQLNKLKQETEDYIYRCAAEAKKTLEDVDREAHDLDMVEQEAAEVLKASRLKLQEAIKENEEEIQSCAQELFMLVDSVSKFKEYVGSKISEMKSDLSDTAVAVSDSYRGSFPAQFVNLFNFSRVR
ncbi:hypothetical protein QN277_009754 [Acacia crassicarpa]|uniref:Kinetochore protein NDC80 n=1 Tax=Acacia crassicarpa TaxID=499986 RepID=A0AAE1IPN6_9FABA|nr:hypothetical protein QN277_009754 [Acacia crassicarpa]